MRYATPDYNTIELYLKQHLANKEIIQELQKSSMTPNYEPMPSGHGVNRTTENVAVRQLEPYKQKWYDAIEMTFSYLKTSKYYEEVCSLITLMYFMDWLGEHDAKYRGKQNIGLELASQKLHMSTATATRRKKLFFKTCWDFRRNE